MVLPQAMAWVQYWFRVLSLKFCGKSKKNCRDISQVSPAFCMYDSGMNILDSIVWIFFWMNIPDFVLNWIIFRPYSMKKWIFKTDRPWLFACLKLCISSVPVNCTRISFFIAECLGWRCRSWLGRSLSARYVTFGKTGGFTVKLWLLGGRGTDLSIISSCCCWIQWKRENSKDKSQQMRRGLITLIIIEGILRL